MGLAPLLGQPHIGHPAHVIARVTVHPVHRRPMVAPNAIDLVGSREMRFLNGQITVNEWPTFNHRSTSLRFLPLSSLHLSDLPLISPSLGSPLSSLSIPRISHLISLYPSDLSLSSLFIPWISPLISFHPSDLPSHLSLHPSDLPLSSLSISWISPSHLSLSIPRISPSVLSPSLGSPLSSLSIPRTSLSHDWSPSLGSPFLGSLLSVPRITDLRPCAPSL